MGAGSTPETLPVRITTRANGCNQMCMGISELQQSGEPFFSILKMNLLVV